jgi:hypothetical protein
VDGSLAEVLQRPHRQADRLLRTLLVVATLAFAGSAQAATGDGAKLAVALKGNLVSFYKKKAPDYRFTKVTCVLPSGATIGHCKAYFTNAARRETGWYAVTVHVDRSTGGVTWQETKGTCKDTKTGATVKC